MYKVALVLSTIPSYNVYRAALEEAFRSGAYDHFLICSGFFHERINKRGAFYASDAFANAVLPAGSTVTVVGAYDPAATEFDDFVNKVDAGLNAAGGPVAVTKRRSLRQYANHWHAKIFIAREGQTHRFAVVGSSNLTRSAFNLTASNNEADVLLWDDSHTPTRQIVNAALGRPPDGQNDNASNPSVIVSNYDPDDQRNSGQGSLDFRLQGLWNDVIAATTDDA
ncbi:hypothetical protein DFR40_0917 [Azonexus fungiphilus]|jgi:hypothetical protein|uniref:Phospholipase D-like protein n=1 Tax=Azonexus fungiphilus TaxID=146940 RepID=A0A495WGE8_9RHOO|nr:phospholipase D family protein [Azonexus fungiphilus]RKT60771.1 hypothetical protein DFR40_0917 [Azonexus fungiphilus]